jgi:hypothetical protein
MFGIKKSHWTVKHSCFSRTRIFVTSRFPIPGRKNLSRPLSEFATIFDYYNEMLIQWLVLAHRNILGIKLNLNFSADADLVVLGRRNWPPTLEEYEAVSVAAENVALNPLNRTSTLRSCHGEILFLGYYAKNQTVIGKNSTLFIGTGTHQRASKGARAPAS